jgi:glutathione S-transferase
MQLIGMLDSPYVRRVAIAALLADIPFRHHPISLFRHIDAFTKLSPLLIAPSLIADDGTVLVESNVILGYLATLSPKLAALRPSALPAFRAEGVALTVCEKAVQLHYERALRAPEQICPDWVARVRGQLDIGLATLEREVSETAWIHGAEIGVADISVACAFGFIQGVSPDLVDLAGYPRLAAFSGRAEALAAF